MSQFSFWLAALAHWTGTHFGRSCLLVYGTGRVCLGSGGSRSRPTDMDSGKLAFMSRMLRPALLKPCGEGASPQILTLSRGLDLLPGAWGAPFYGNADGALGRMPSVSGLWPCAWTHLKKSPRVALVRLVGHTTNTRRYPMSIPKTRK